MKVNKIYLEQGKMNPDMYTVTKLVNRLAPKVGAQLKTKDVEMLMSQSENLTVEVTTKKK